MHWLTRKPPKAARILDALLAALPDDSSNRWWTIEAISGAWPAQLETEVLEDLLDRLLSRLEPWRWWHYAKHLKGMSVFFHAVLERQEDCKLAAWMYPHRRDDGACRDALRTATMRGTVLLDSSSEILKQIGDAAAVGTRRDQEAADPAGSCESLRARANVVAWLEQHDLLRILTPDDALPDELRFSCEVETRWGSPERFFLTLALP